MAFRTVSNRRMYRAPVAEIAWTLKHVAAGGRGVHRRRTRTRVLAAIHQMRQLAGGHSPVLEDEVTTKRAMALTVKELDWHCLLQNPNVVRLASQIRWPFVACPQLTSCLIVSDKRARQTAKAELCHQVRVRMVDHERCRSSSLEEE